MTERRRPDQEIEIGDEGPALAQTTSLAAEDLARFKIHTEEGESAEGITELTFVALRLARVIHAFV